jgi:hypothetical protein
MLNMSALEFKTKISNDQIQIPAIIQSELRANKDKDIRVILLVDDPDNNDDLIFRDMAGSYFLKGYAGSDPI